MVRTTSRFAAVALACAWLLAGDQRVAARIQTDVDAVARRAFAERVERYAMLRARLEEPLPAFDARRDPWSLLLTRRYLASAIRAARPRACLEILPKFPTTPASPTRVVTNSQQRGSPALQLYRYAGCSTPRTQLQFDGDIDAGFER